MQFLELYRAVCGALLFSQFLSNSKVMVFCNNQAGVQMLTSSCKHCMILIRLFTLTAMKSSVNYEVQYIKSVDNTPSNFLSRQKLKLFGASLPAGICLERLHTPKALVPQEKFSAFT